MNIEESYPKALEYLYSFVDYSLSKTFRYAPVKFELSRVQKLMELIGNPHTHYPILHVAGTKGKGSTAYFLADMFRKAGFKTGLYTSPHITNFTERIKVNGSNIFSAAADSLIFPTIAFGGFMPLIVLGQFAAKVCGGFLWTWAISKFKK